MADTKQLPEDIMRDIARQVGDRIAEELSSAAEAVPPAPVEGAEPPEDFSPLAGIDPATARFKIAESFEVWELRADADEELADTDEDLVTLALPTNAYRHQVRLVQDGAEKTVAFAQSSPSTNDPNKWVVRDFYFTSLAAQLDKAIKEADKRIPDDAVTRLLSLPAFKVEALWFVMPSKPAEPSEGPQEPGDLKTLWVMVASAPPSFSGKTLTLIDSSTFIRALSGTRRGMGLLL